MCLLGGDTGEEGLCIFWHGITASFLPGSKATIDIKFTYTWDEPLDINNGKLIVQLQLS